MPYHMNIHDVVELFEAGIIDGYEARELVKRIDSRASFLGTFQSKDE